MQEPFTEALQMGYDVGILHDELTLGEAFMRLIDAGIIGFGVGAGMGGAVELTYQADTPVLKEVNEYEEHATALRLDLTRKNQEKAALEVLEKNTDALDQAVNNAGAGMTDEELQSLVDEKLWVNVLMITYLIQLLVELIKH